MWSLFISNACGLFQQHKYTNWLVNYTKSVNSETRETILSGYIHNIKVIQKDLTDHVKRMQKNQIQKKF